MKGIRVSGPLVSIVAAATSTIVYTLGTTRPERVIIRKVLIFNRQAATILLSIGFDTVAAVFTQVLPQLSAVANIPVTYNEDDLPICGNTPEGFQADTAAVTGTLGNIVAQASAAAAAPANVLIRVEVEIF